VHDVAWTRARRSIRGVARAVGPAVGLGLPRLLRHPVWTTAEATGNGVGAVVVPGFGGTDASMTVLRRWLGRRGFRVIGGRLRLNVACTADLVDQLERRVADLAAATGGPVVLIGHSRGGWLCRLVAVRRPELVRGLVMFGSPVLDPLDAHGAAKVALGVLVRLADKGVRGLLGTDCISGACRDVTVDGLTAPLTVPALAIYSRDDGVVGWRSCQDPAAEWVEVRSSHAGMGTDPELYAAVAERLALWTAGRSEPADVN